MNQETYKDKEYVGIKTEKYMKAIEYLLLGLDVEGSDHKQWCLMKAAKYLRVSDNVLKLFDEGIAPEQV